MPRFRLILSYDGTDFAGWQAQSARSGARTVQGVLEGALSGLAGGQRVAVMGAGRTDAGVHALGQVASFELPRAIEAEALQRALNGLLPPDVRVCGAAAAPPGFDARRSARSKLYRYELDTGPVRLPLRRRVAGHVPWTLDEARVAAVAAFYRGQHDFAATASSGGSATTTVRTITRSEVAFAGPPGARTLVYEVEAGGFLRKMVRSLVGGLIAVGRGERDLAALRAALLGRDRRAWPAPAAAEGLTLIRVDYDGPLTESPVLA
jgi:tRNA pseudouridine38-40 synthase